MFQINKLKMWRDPGYTRQCTEVPPVGSKKLPTPDYSYVADATHPPFRPRKNSTLTGLVLSIPYLEVWDMSYLYIEISEGENDAAIFGWITSVERLATSEDSIRISWTCDHWRTFSDQVMYCSGTIRNAASATAGRRPTSYTPSKWSYKSVEYITEQSNEATDLWMYALVIGQPLGIAGRTVFNLVYCPLINNRVATSIDGQGNIAQIQTTMSLEDAYNGLIDEYLAWSTTPTMFSTVVGVWIGNVPPVSGWYTETYQGVTVWRQAAGPSSLGGYMIITEAVNIPETSTPNPYASNTLCLDTWFYDKSGQRGNVITHSYAQSMTADDTHRYIVMDPFGNDIGEIPWGWTFKDVEVSLDIGPSGAYGYVTIPSANGAMKERAAQIDGLRFTYALPAVALTENYRSSYIISGQRDAMIENMRISRERQFTERMLNVGTSAAQGAAVGMLSGHSAAGAAVGAATGLTGAIAGRYVSEKYDDQLVAVEDMLASKHSNGVALNGDGNIWAGWHDAAGTWGYQCGPVIAELSMGADEDIYDELVSLSGVECFIPFTSPRNFANYTGALRITELMIRGSIPAESKTAIKVKLEKGVRIIERNPTGTDPGA